MTNDIANGSLTTDIINNIATISFAHPAGNSFPAALLRLLTDELSRLSAIHDLNVIVLKSAGNGPFCAGASFDELMAVSNLTEGTAFFSGFANVINAMRQCTKIIVGRVHGKAVGGGVGLAAACDYTFATQQASVKLSELAIGIGPFVIEPAVSRKIGKAALAELTLAAEDWQTAQWAHGKGLYSKVFDTTEAMDSALADFCNKLSSYNPAALAEMKTTLWQGTEDWGSLLYERAAISGRLVLSDFTKQALQKFKK